MKLHPEISIGWITVYACLLAALSGKTATEQNFQADNINRLGKDSISVKRTQFFKHNSDMIDPSKKVIHIGSSKK